MEGLGLAGKVYDWAAKLAQLRTAEARERVYGGILCELALNAIRCLRFRGETRGALDPETAIRAGLGDLFRLLALCLHYVEAHAARFGEVRTEALARLRGHRRIVSRVAQGERLDGLSEAGVSAALAGLETWVTRYHIELKEVGHV